MTEEEQAKIDDYHALVYKLGGAVTTCLDDTTGEHHYAAVSLPGLITKHEPIDLALVRIGQYQQSKVTE